MQTSVPKAPDLSKILLGILLVFALVGLLGVPSSLAQEDTAKEDAAQEDTAQEHAAQEDTAQEDTAQEDTAQEDTAHAEGDESGTSVPEPEAFKGKRVVYGKIDGDITLAESAFVNRLLDRANQEKADVVLIELNTFGGRVDAAVAIRDALMDAPQETVVFINKRAISAGALISLACNRVAISSGGTIGAATPISTSPGQELPEAVEEKYLSYFRQEMRSTAETRDRDGDIAEAFVDKDKEIPDVSEKGKLLTLTTRTALEHKIADFEAKSIDEVLVEIDASVAGMVKVERSWSELLAAFLTSQAIASLLMLGLIVFGYLEYQTPGFGFFGTGAIVCFLMLYFSHYLVNLAGHEELVLFGLGVLLIAVELLVAPGAAIFATLGAACILGSTVLLLIAGDWSDVSFENPFTQDALELVALSLVGSFVAMLAIARFFVLPVKGEGTRGGLLLQAELSTEEGYLSHEEDPEAESWVGRSGQALTPLRPAGKALIEGRRCNVETEGEFVDKGDAIEVLRRLEGRIVVQKSRLADDSVAAETSSSEDQAEGQESDHG